MPDSSAYMLLLKKLNVNKGDLVFFHTSFKRMSYLGFSPEQLIEALIDYLGPKATLVMPSYAWNLDKTQRPWAGYKLYFERRPVFDVVNTESNMGVISELFRGMPGVKRSLDYWWPVCAMGPLAQELTAGQEKLISPYGPGSTFDLLRINNVKIVGLGVTLNTTSLALITDYQLGKEHTQKVFTDTPQEGAVIDYRGNRITTRSFWMLPEVVRCIKPSEMINASRKIRESLKLIETDGVVQFSYPYEIYYKESMRMGEEASGSGDKMPWLKEYPLK